MRAVVVLVAGIALAIPIANADGQTIDGLNAKLDDARGQAEALGADIEDKILALASARQRAATAAGREAQLATLLARGQERSAELAEEVRQARDELAEAKARLKRALAALSDRLVAIYKSGETNEVDVLLDADGFDDLSTRAELLGRIQAADRALAERVRDLRTAIADQLADVERAKERADAYNARVDAARAEMAAARAEAEAEAAALDDARAAQVAALDGLQTQMAGWSDRVQKLEEISAAEADSEVAGWAGTGDWAIPEAIVICESGGNYGALNATSAGWCSASSSARAPPTLRWARHSRRRWPMPDETPDVLIIGAGASGAVAAKRLVSEGFDVVCLEQGEWPDYTLARAAHPDYELTAARDWNWDPNLRAAPADYPVDDSDSDITALMWNGVGGGTVVYAAHWQRNMPSDFRVRTLDGVADDWPLTYEDLEPYYVRVERDWGVSGLAGDTGFPAGDGPPMPPVPMGEMGRRVARAHNELGWHWWPAPNAIATRPYGRLNACVQRATCLRGCADGAKASVDITYWPDAIERGAKLRAGARVKRLIVGSDGLVEGALYIDADGVEQVQRAAVTILCCNGIGTPRLLFCSATDEQPEGLANSSGLVGKRLMMHPFGTVTGLFEDDLRSNQGAWGQHIHSLEFYESDPERDFVRGAKWGLQPTGGPLAMTQAYPWGDENSIWGPTFHEEIRRRLGHSAMWGFIFEDLPEEANRVELDPERTDDHGIPAAKLYYEMSENSRRMVEFHEQRAEESLRAAGAYDVIVAPQIRATGWHLLGTCIMGADPASSVVDTWGRTHDVPNLFIFDGSVWPTSSGMNPTATIAALALRFTDHLIAARREQERPL